MKTKYISPELYIVLISARHILTTSADITDPEDEMEVPYDHEINTNDAF